MKVINIDATDLDGTLDNGEFPETIMEAVEAALERMRTSPGGDNEEIRLVISNDFESEEEDEESDDETEKEG